MSEDVLQQYRRYLDDITLAPPVRALIEAHIADLEAASDAHDVVSEGPTPDTSAHHGIDLSQGYIRQMKDIVGRDKIINVTTDTAQINLQQLLNDYLDSISTECQHLTFLDANNYDPHQIHIGIDMVYTMLEVANNKPLPLEGADEGTRIHHNLEPIHLTVIEALSNHGRLMLFGPPGSGKSTLINFIALMLAQSYRNPQKLTKLPGWKHGAVIPIRIDLLSFAEWVDTQNQTVGSADCLWNYLESFHTKELVQLFRHSLRERKALLLLDGYDAVPRRDNDQPLRRVHEALITLQKSPLVLITCRELSATKADERQLVNWKYEHILPLTPHLQEQFILQWDNVFKESNRTPIGDPYQLIQELHSWDELRLLAGNPLLLTLIVHQHAFSAPLSQRRVYLYTQCIDFLLHRWKSKLLQKSLPDILGIPTWTDQNTFDLLDRLGYEAQEFGTALNDGKQMLLRIDLLITQLQYYFQKIDASRARRRALDFMEYIIQYSNGVIDDYDLDNVCFRYRTLQIFLASRRLVSEDDWISAEDTIETRAINALSNPNLQNILRLGVSYLMYSKQLRTAIDIIDAIQEQSKASPFFGIYSASLWMESSKEQLNRLSPRHKLILQRSINEQVNIIQNDATTVDTTMRVQAGFNLAILGDPRPGVCGLGFQWCDVVVDAATHMMVQNNQLQSGQSNPANLVHSFSISRYLITNAQWKLFMESDGYTDPQWWSVAGRHAQQMGIAWDGTPTGNPWIQPAYWGNSKFNAPNQPVVGISWYEAQAFCQWLTHRLGFPILLPTEAQWTFAAEGSSQLTYPWGNEWDTSRANINSNVGHTTIVGCFPHGRSWCGAEDLFGNTWEWIHTDTTSGGNQDSLNHVPPFPRISLYGGAWNTPDTFASSKAPAWNYPQVRSNDIGFRLVTPLEPSEIPD